MRGAAPDRAAFMPAVAEALVHVRAGGHAAVRLYAEMVELLWNDDLEAALRLEALWNEVLVDVRCHSALLPAEDRGGAGTAVPGADGLPCPLAAEAPLPRRSPPPQRARRCIHVHAESMMDDSAAWRGAQPSA